MERKPTTTAQSSDSSENIVVQITVDALTAVIDSSREAGIYNVSLTTGD